MINEGGFPQYDYEEMFLVRFVKYKVKRLCLNVFTAGYQQALSEDDSFAIHV